ncbi:sensor histidine kinase [Spirosoma rigui]|uniref:sensor histidine kinase n=1 Tax=Spirosoma rigui TaxID=564064 RepID=UPI0009AFBBDD|nr:ATP-binding protein [Spirosoma rigui]
MNQLLDFLRRLTDTSDWPPRWYCGNWTDFHGWLYIVSDLTIWLAYMAIPLILIRFVILKKGVPLPSVFILFGAFILLCGATHLVDALMFWWPAYRFNALIRFLTGVVSVATVVALIRYFKEAVGLRTSREFERELLFRQQAVQELSRSNQELQQFAYVASHDLQSPLKTIVNYLTLLESRYGHQLDPDGHKLIDTSTAAAGRMRTLINDLLDFSRVGSVAEFEPVDLNSLIAEIIEEHQDDIRSANATLDIGPLPTLTAHRTDLKQVFQNLITNGLKYRRPDVDTRLRISATDLGAQYQFSVADNGIGIEPQYYERVFQIFQRLHGRGHYPGTGIGLATCKKVIDIYGGKIWVASEPNVGSTFYLTIPKKIKTVQHYAETDQLHPVN